MATKTAQATILVDGREMSGTIEHTQEIDTFYSDSPEPDIGWSTRDAQGHLHGYAHDGSLPTLKRAFGEPWWCDSCNDEHRDSWWVCDICEERIELATKPPSALPKSVVTGVTARIEVRGHVTATRVQVTCPSGPDKQAVMVGEVVEQTLVSGELPLVVIVATGPPHEIAVR